MENKYLEENIEERNYTQEIFDLIRKTKNSKLLAQTLTNYHDNDIADALTYLSPDERKRLYKAIGIEATSRILAYLDEDVDKYFAELENESAADIFKDATIYNAGDMIVPATNYIVAGGLCKRVPYPETARQLNNNTPESKLLSDRVFWDAK